MTYILRKHKVCQIGIHPYNIPSGIALCKGSFINDENMAGDGGGFYKFSFTHLFSKMVHKRGSGTKMFKELSTWFMDDL